MSLVQTSPGSEYSHAEYAWDSASRAALAGPIRVTLLAVDENDEEAPVIVLEIHAEPDGECIYIRQVTLEADGFRQDVTSSKSWMKYAQDYAHRLAESVSDQPERAEDWLEDAFGFGILARLSRLSIR